jgi:DnaJ-class molecular chaperone
MTPDTLYRELELEEGASVNEIKAAYRRMAKSCHPDSAATHADPDRFSRASAAYRSLLKEVMGVIKGPASGIDSLSGQVTGNPAPTAYRFIGRKTVGLDVFYDLMVEDPGPGKSVEVEIPWVRREACPRCLGQGETLERDGGGFVLSRSACPRCGGKGYEEEKRASFITLTPEMLKRGRVRVTDAGGYLPKEGRRGDLVLTLRVTDRMPRSN